LIYRGYHDGDRADTIRLLAFVIIQMMIKPTHMVAWKSGSISTTREDAALLKIADNSNADSMAGRMRAKRFLAFLALTNDCPKQRVSVLDVGGTEQTWAANWTKECNRLDITLLNVRMEKTSGKFPIRAMIGDARDIAAADRSYDFAYSNSVIEHVGTFADQERMAFEIQRASIGYFVQTPYRFFPLEPHFQFPFWAQLPISLQTELHSRFTLGWMKAEPNRHKALEDIKQIRLLTVKEARRLFPTGEIKIERFGPLIKSLMAVRSYA
jgi:hypothetical protein